jgi:hypothetical protein
MRYLQVSLVCIAHIIIIFLGLMWFSCSRFHCWLGTRCTLHFVKMELFVRIWRWLKIVVTDCHHHETLKPLYFQCYFARSMWVVIQIGPNLSPPRSVANIFEKWLHAIYHMFRTLIRVRALAVIWSLWLCLNDNVCNDQNAPLSTLCSWVVFTSVEYHDFFMKICMWLEATSRDTYS